MEVHRYLWIFRSKDEGGNLAATMGTQKKYNLPWVCVGDFNEILGGHEEGSGVGSIQGCGG